MLKGAFEKLKGWVGVVQGMATIAAIVAGAAWFLLQGEQLTKANVELNVESRRLDPEPLSLVSVTLKISNVGKREIVMSSGAARLQQVLPLDKDIQNALQKGGGPMRKTVPGQIAWPIVGEPFQDIHIDMKIRPGEAEQFVFDFVVPSKTKTVRVYAQVADSTNKEKPYVWRAMKLYDITPNKT